MKIINDLEDQFEIDKYISQTSPEIANKITSILMLEERDILHKWESRKIVVEAKNVNLAQSVNETILSYRWYLLNRIIEANKKTSTAFFILKGFPSASYKEVPIVATGTF